MIVRAFAIFISSQSAVPSHSLTIKSGPIRARPRPRGGDRTSKIVACNNKRHVVCDLEVPPPWEPYITEVNTCSFLGLPVSR